MTRELAKTIITRLIDRGLAPTLTKLSDDEYSIAVVIPPGAAQNVAPADLEAVIALGVGVKVESVKFT